MCLKISEKLPWAALDCLREIGRAQRVIEICMGVFPQLPGFDLGELSLRSSPNLPANDAGDLLHGPH